MGKGPRLAAEVPESSPSCVSCVDNMHKFSRILGCPSLFHATTSDAQASPGSFRARNGHRRWGHGPMRRAESGRHYLSVREYVDLVRQQDLAIFPASPIFLAPSIPLYVPPVLAPTLV